MSIDRDRESAGSHRARWKSFGWLLLLAAGERVGTPRGVGTSLVAFAFAFALTTLAFAEVVVVGGSLAGTSGVGDSLSMPLLPAAADNDDARASAAAGAGGSHSPNTRSSSSRPFSRSPDSGFRRSVSERSGGPATRGRGLWRRERGGTMGVESRQSKRDGLWLCKARRSPPPPPPGPARTPPPPTPGPVDSERGRFNRYFLGKRGSAGGGSRRLLVLVLVLAKGSEDLGGERPTS